MSRRFYVYQHLNLAGEVIYVGRTIDMGSRQLTHSIKAKHKKQIESVRYAEVQTKTAMMMYEWYYISKLQPLYNIVDNRGDSIDELKGLPELHFKTYIRKENYNLWGKEIEELNTVIPNSKYRGEMCLVSLEEIEEDNNLNKKQWKLLMYIMNSIANEGFMTESNDYLGYVLHDKPKHVQGTLDSLEAMGLVEVKYFNDLEGLKRVININIRGNSPLEIETASMYSERQNKGFCVPRDAFSWQEFREIEKIIPCEY